MGSNAFWLVVENRAKASDFAMHEKCELEVALVAQSVKLSFVEFGHNPGFRQCEPRLALTHPFQ